MARSMLLRSLHFGMAADLPSRYFVCVPVSVCEHCNDFSAGRTRGKYREDPCSEMENVIKRCLTESGCVAVDWIQLT